MKDSDILLLAEEGESASEVSARKKALLLGRQLGLASEQEYRPANASIAERAQHRARKLSSEYQANVET
ncbi:MAG: TIGR03899 family protein, partial [Shewanella oncorhynchi]